MICQCFRCRKSKCSLRLRSGISGKDSRNRLWTAV